jgi:hypothetical protein
LRLRDPKGGYQFREYSPDGQLTYFETGKGEREDVSVTYGEGEQVVSRSVRLPEGDLLVMDYNEYGHLTEKYRETADGNIFTVMQN